jgi:hypothetical protein
VDSVILGALQKWGGRGASEADWNACLIAASKGYSPEKIIAALIAHSPDIAARKKGHIDDYVNRTVDKVFELSSVQESRSRVLRDETERGNGYNFLT